jgi:UDP-glucose 4-epimerase
MSKAQKKVLITGAAGVCGRILTEGLAGCYDLVLTDRYRPQEENFEQLIVADISDPAAILEVCEGVDVVVHLAADPRPDAPWESLMPNNVLGAYNVFEAAFQSGCKRMIFASSIQAIYGYPAENLLVGNLPPSPTNLYGATKTWGEALARVYAEKGLSCICLRLGWVKGGEEALYNPRRPGLEMILTARDLTSLIIAAIDAPADIKFGVFHGLSDNSRKYVDISITREALGYTPQDDAYRLAWSLPNVLRLIQRRIGYR